jgi:serine/threonine-protein kinase 11
MTGSGFLRNICGMLMISGAKGFGVITQVEDTFDAAVKRRRRVNSYLFRKKIGKGSSAKVYVATDIRTGDAVAIKEINLQELARATGGVAQLEREIRLMASLDHPNILKMQEILYVEDSQVVYLVLDYAENGSLGNYVEQGIKIPRDAVLSIIKQVVNAILYVHSKGFVHHDIKPGNILMGMDGRAYLADFGIGHSFESAAMVVGSPAFQAPEALSDDHEGEIDPQGEDCWALGITLFQLMFGTLPFKGTNLYEIVCDIQSRPLTFPSTEDSEVIDLLQGMLTVNPACRMKLEQVRDHPCISGAEDLASTLPSMPEDIEMMVGDGRVSVTLATVCQPDHSFANMNLKKGMVPSPSLRMCANAPGSLGRHSWRRSNSCMLEGAE